MTIITEAEMKVFNVLIRVDSDYFWFVTRAVSPAKAKANAQLVTAKKLFGDVEYPAANISKLKSEHNFAMYVDDEIDAKLWKRANALRAGSKPSLPSKEDLIEKVNAFMHRFYGYDVLEYPLDKAKLKKNALTYGFTESEIANYAFTAAVDAYIYSHLK